MGNCNSVNDKSSKKKQKDNENKYENQINNLNEFQNKYNGNLEERMKKLEKQLNNFGFNENENEEKKNDNNKKVINNNKNININEKKLEDIEIKEIKKQDDIFDNFEKQLKSFDF